MAGFIYASPVLDTITIPTLYGGSTEICPESIFTSSLTTPFQYFHKLEAPNIQSPSSSFIGYTRGQNMAYPAVPMPSLIMPSQFSGEGRLEDPAAFINEFIKISVPAGWITDKLKYQVLSHLFVGDALEWFRELNLDEIPFDSAADNCFVTQFINKFLTEDKQNDMQEMFYARIQNPNEMGEDYISAKVALWRKVDRTSKVLSTEQLMSVRRGLEPSLYNNFFL